MRLNHRYRRVMGGICVLCCAFTFMGVTLLSTGCDAALSDAVVSALKDSANSLIEAGFTALEDSLTGSSTSG
jgi:hypothetical protein